MPRVLVLASAVAAVCLGSAAPPVHAQRTLHWRELAVHARLEADGTLAVREDHAMVFTGDWNGGERTFRIRFGQELTVDRVSRRDPAGGAWVPLERGSLGELDHWDMPSQHTLRWRSRRPSDPPFDGTEIDYRLEYRLRGILRRAGDGWRLDHDFAFADRTGEIARFVLDLELAPEWQAPADGVRHLDEGPLPPGAGRVVTMRLRYVGAGEPEHAAAPRVPPLAIADIVLAAAVAVLGLLRWAFAREVASGRLAPLPIGEVDRAWLDRRLFVLAPEEAGAAWDEAVGSAEVAAMLARLQLEGKIASTVEATGLWRRPNLRLSLRVARATLAPAERELVEGLFPTGDETDTASLREHYRRTGFDPAAKLGRRLRDRLRALGGFSAARLPPPRLPSAVLLALAAATLGLAVVLRPLAFAAPLAIAVAAVLLWVPAFIIAFVFRRRVVAWRAPLAAIVGLAVASLAALALLGTLPGLSPLGLAGGALLVVGLAQTVATAMQSRQGAETVSRRRDLATARAWFARELGKQQPQLLDAWAPYLIAFGLAPRMDHWWKAFGSTARGSAPAASWGSGGGGASAAGAGAAWTGGGGSFGGAGATASWALAATSMSAGVAAAGSSGGGGGGGGGGSSGGGGGGGW